MGLLNRDNIVFSRSTYMGMLIQRNFAVHQADRAEGARLERNAHFPHAHQGAGGELRTGLRPGLSHVRVAVVPRVHLLYCPSTQLRECIENQGLRSSFFPHHGFKTVSMCLRGPCRTSIGRRTMRGRSDTDVSFRSRATVGTWCGYLTSNGAVGTIIKNERGPFGIWGGLSFGSSCLS
jgi:hypothetical protein